ncbi:MAG: ADP-glyceromanno-heptose 6-epimerase [Chlamydiota bacterium]
MKTELFDDQLIVITGAAGFIGSNVVRCLNDEGYANLLLIDDLDMTEKWKNLSGKRFIDLMSQHDLFDFLDGKEKEIEAFIHLGACSDTTELDGEYMIENNYRFSVRLADYALSHGHRFIYASSAATYGDGSHGFSDAESELDQLEPMNLYGFSKHLFDKWLKEQGALDAVVGLKYFNIFGPNEWHKERMASMVLHMFEQIGKTGKVELFQSSDPKRFTDGNQQRDFYYVKDAAHLTCFFLDHDINGIFNVGSGEALTWNKLANMVFSAMGKKEKIDYIPMPEDLTSQYQNYSCADQSKLKQELKKYGLSFNNCFTTETAVQDYVKNHLISRKRW